MRRGQSNFTNCHSHSICTHIPQVLNVASLMARIHHSTKDLCKDTKQIKISGMLVFRLTSTRYFWRECRHPLFHFLTLPKGLEAINILHESQSQPEGLEFLDTGCTTTPKILILSSQ